METFKIGLYREHLEEASALYELRRSLLHEPNREWVSLGDFEARLEAHLDALVIGGPLALQVCAEQMRDGDVGELFAGLSVCCRQQEASLFATVWREVDFSDPARVQAVIDALKFELPSAWIPAAEQTIAHGDENRFSILAVVAAARRLPVGEGLAARLRQALPADPGPVWALARLQGTGAVQALENCLLSRSPEVRLHALLGLLRAGDRRALHACYLTAQTEDWPHLAMGLAGDRRAATILRQQLEAGRAARHTVIALGLLGDLSTVRALTTVLASEALGGIAALALHWITGAPLYEDVFVADPVDELELFEGEKAAWREHGTIPRRADGRPYGSEVRQLSRALETWNRWLSEHATQFNPDLRYRLGIPYSPRAVLESVVAPTAPPEWRQLAADEMALRYACPVPFDAEGRVIEQLASIGMISQWVHDNEGRFEGTAGRFFGGGA